MSRLFGKASVFFMILLITFLLVLKLTVAENATQDCLATRFYESGTFCSPNFTLRAGDTCCTPLDSRCTPCFRDSYMDGMPGCPIECFLEALQYFDLPEDGEEEGSHDGNGAVTAKDNRVSTTSKTKRSKRSVQMPRYDHEEFVKEYKDKYENETKDGFKQLYHEEVPECHQGQFDKSTGKAVEYKFGGSSIYIIETVLGGEIGHHCYLYNGICGRSRSWGGAVSSALVPNEKDRTSHSECKRLSSYTPDLMINIDDPNSKRECLFGNGLEHFGEPVFHYSGMMIMVQHMCTIQPLSINECSSRVKLQSGSVCLSLQSDRLSPSSTSYSVGGIEEHAKFMSYFERCYSIEDVNKKVIHGVCNTSPFRFNILISDNDICQATYPGHWLKVSRAWCLHPSAFNGLIIVSGILLIFYFLYYIFSLIIFILTWQLSGFVRRFKSRGMCKICGIKLTASLLKKHKCNLMCYRCGKYFGTESAALSHIQLCKGTKKPKMDVYYDYAEKVMARLWLFMKSVHYLWAAIVLFQIADAEFIRTEGNECAVVPDINKIGLLRKSIDSHYDRKDCDYEGFCTSRVTIDTEIQLQVGTLESWVFKTESGVESTATVYIQDVVEKCSFIHQYYTCTSEPKGRYAHSCVGEAKVHERLKYSHKGRAVPFSVVKGKACRVTSDVKELWQPYNYYKDTVANQICDTCVTTTWDSWVCWDVRKEVPCERVVLQKGCQTVVTLVAVIGGQCWKGDIVNGERLDATSIIIRSQKSSNEMLPVLLTLDNQVLTGMINGLGEYDDKYGRMQWNQCPDVIKPNTTGTVRCKDGTTFEAYVPPNADTLCVSGKAPNVAARKTIHCDSGSIEVHQCVGQSSTDRGHLLYSGDLVNGMITRHMIDHLGTVRIILKIPGIEAKRRESKDERYTSQAVIDSATCSCRGYTNRDESTACILSLVTNTDTAFEFSCNPNEIYIPNGYLLTTSGKGEYRVGVNLRHTGIANCSISDMNVNCDCSSEDYIPANMQGVGIWNPPVSVDRSWFEDLWQVVATFFVGIWQSVFSIFSSVRNFVSFIVILAIILICIMVYRASRSKRLYGTKGLSDAYARLRRRGDFYIDSSGERVNL